MLDEEHEDEIDPSEELNHYLKQAMQNSQATLDLIVSHRALLQESLKYISKRNEESAVAEYLVDCVKKHAVKLGGKHLNVEK